MSAASPEAPLNVPLPSAVFESERIETDTQERGKTLFRAVRRMESSKTPIDWFYDSLMQLTTADEKVKVELFRFVDALPSLKTPDAVNRHLQEYLLRSDVKLPPLIASVLSTATGVPLLQGPVAWASHFGAKRMAERFIAGRNGQEAAAAIERLRSQDRTFTLDLLGEAVTSEAEALAYQAKYLELIEDLARIARRWPDRPRIDQASFGPLPKVNVSVKLSSLYSRFDPMAADTTVEAVKERLRPILRSARRHGIFVNFDMEQRDYCGITRRIFEEVFCEEEFANWGEIGIVVQAYLRDAERQLAELRDYSLRRGVPFTIRLVKGAYWDYETIISAQRGHPVPVWQNKADTDACYERCTEFLIRNWTSLRPAFATHNVRSAAHAQALAATHGLPPATIEFQVLYGMGDPIGRALAAQGERVRVYVPFGELLPGMAYLVRRLLENSSNDSFIRKAGENVRIDALLAPPRIHSISSVPTGGPPAGGTASAFVNEPETDFAEPRNQEAMRAALSVVRAELGKTVLRPSVVVDENAPRIIDRPCPNDTRLVASRTRYATAAEATEAVRVAAAAFPVWRDTPVRERCAVLRKAADHFRARRFEIAAWMVFEVGKPWREADADVAEAIDFCEFYAAEMERLSHPRRRNIPGEWNEFLYDARGPAVIIAPWNFPLAILTGMATAALVAGNPVLLKPAEQSSRVGFFLYEALTAAGCPEGVATYVPGDGEEIGPTLVNDPRVALIAFTGSKTVGLSILESAAVVRPGQREIKKVIAELGGKNAILVDEDADPDEAVLGTLHSFVGFAGQKCSACSRVVVIGSAYEPFCARLAEAVKSIRIGPADDPATTLGPVVDEESQRRVERYTEIGKAEGRMLAQVPVPESLRGRGYYVPATVFTDCPADGRLCQEEIFGPVLAVLRAADLTEALKIADDTPYALTGGFYSRSPKNIERARREFRVGNLYINRKITGAIVDRQPFGGARMSGIGSKAGGPDYLLQFLNPRTITESVLRRGFAPSAEPGGE
ncbi:MAG: proline dehydrogenase family protein [Capsulimonadales bacterium]|nr:proline dehydrogenase family protein [Capsulimonadales bacterium]